MIFKLFRGGQRALFSEDIRKKAHKGSKAREFWDEKKDDILEDLYRVGFLGNVKENDHIYSWRWNYKGDTGVLEDDWKLVVHVALCSELSIDPAVNI